jgi:hypothetical protein
MALTDKLVAIADALRSRLGTEETFTLNQMPGEIDRVWEKGMRDFLDFVPQRMNRYHFAGSGWNADTFYPRGEYTCAVQNPQYVFAYHNLEHPAYDLAQRIADCGAEFDWQIANRIDYGFSCANVTRLPALDFAHMTRLISVFYRCTALRSIDMLTLGAQTEYNQIFSGCTALENLPISGTIGQDGFDVSECPLNRESLLGILQALQPGANHTVTLGAANLEKLTEEEKAIATEKGWTLQ